MRTLLAIFLVACTASPAPPADAPVDIPAVALTSDAVWPPPMVPLATAPDCPATNPPPCVVEVVSYAEPAQIGYRLCCQAPGFRIAALAVDSSVGPWGDVTAWSLCGWGYVVEVTHPLRGGTLPWAVLDTYDGHGGPIAECRSQGAP